MAVTSADPAGRQARTDGELLAALPVDRAGVLGVLYDRHGGLVYGLAMKILGNPTEADDLTQEIFLTLCTRCDYDPARGPLAAYLVTLTRSRALDKVRARTRKTRILEHWGDAVMPAAPPAPFEQIASAECTERVRAALADLPDAQRQVLEMAYYRGLSQTEIAAELETPLGTVKSWARKGLLRLRDSLAPLAG